MVLNQAFVIIKVEWVPHTLVHSISVSEVQLCARCMPHTSRFTQRMVHDGKQAKDPFAKVTSMAFLSFFGASM